MCTRETKDTLKTAPFSQWMNPRVQDRDLQNHSKPHDAFGCIVYSCGAFRFMGRPSPDIS
jgi:hypothetical protein